jgi:hypothetical protein
MRLLSWTLPPLILLLCVAPAQATPITYTVTGTATGVLGVFAFTDALVTITLVGDTSFVGNDFGSATVSVTGIGTASFTDTMSVTANSVSPSAQVSDSTSNRLTFGTIAPFAWYAIEGVVAPYIHDLERRVKVRHEDEALQGCRGIVTGLYRAAHSGFELHEYAEDAPSELAGRAVDIWRRRLCLRAPLRRDVHA